MAAIIDEAHSQLDQTVRIFDSFYQFDLVVSQNDHDVVYSYFYDVTKSKNIATNFTGFLFRIANLTGNNVQLLLDYIKGRSKLEVNGLMAYYLNSIKSKTTLYGISASPKPNEPVQRNVVV